MSTEFAAPESPSAGAPQLEELLRTGVREIRDRPQLPLSSSSIQGWPAREELPLLHLLFLHAPNSPVPLGPVGSRFALTRAGILRDTLAIQQLGALQDAPPAGYVATLVEVARAISADGRDDEAMLLSRLLWEFVGRSPESHADGDWESVAIVLIQIASKVLARAPNGLLYEGVWGVAAHLITRLRELGDTHRLAEGLSAVGQLPLQAYGGRPGGIAWWSDPDAWRTQLATVIPPELRGDLDRFEMPAALAEVEKAVALLGESVARRRGASRGRTRATYAQALRLLGTGREVPPADIAREARAALAELEVEDRPLQWVACLQLLDQFDPSGSTDASVRRVDFGAIRERHGEVVSVILLTELARLDTTAVPDNDLVDALVGLLVALREVVLTNEQRSSFLQAAVHVVAGKLLTCAEAKTAMDSAARLERLNQSHDAGEINDLEYGRALAHVAAHIEDDPAAALAMARIADAWCAEDPARAMTTWRVAITALQAALEAASGDVVAAVDAAAEAAVAFTEVDLHPQSRVAVRLATDRATAAADAVTEVILQSFGTRILKLQVLGDAEDLEVLHGLGLAASMGGAPSTGEPGNPIAMLAHSQLFKGLLFSVSLDGPGPWAKTEAEHEAAGQVAELEGLLRLEDDSSREDDWDEDIDFFEENPELLRCAYLGLRERLSGHTVAGRLSNARLDFDERVTQRRHTGQKADLLERTQGLVPALSYEDVCAALGPDTVLLDFFLGLRSPGHLRTVYATAYTSEGVIVHALKFNDGEQGHSFTDPSEHGRLVVVHPMAHRIAALRSELQEYAAPRMLTREAEEILASADQFVWGALGETLGELRATGRSHLCIWPHGPLHFAPMHLMQVDGSPLADDWTVTSIPSTRCLLPPRFRSETQPDLTVLSVGVPDGGLAHGLSRAPSLRTQADLVAAAFGTTALPEAQCTPAEVLRQMERARFVHLAGHGSASGGSPLWQHLYLAAGEDGEGRLFAHDVLEADLRNVELVTLSACESALGRVDALDNLRGLPAALMLAGAQAIIGTLWPVHPDPAAHFFAALYQRLAEGRSRLEGFRDAQVETRSTYPEYRHWGAFTYVGGWK